MKSAYELAMERLKAQGEDSAPLSDKQKAALAEIDQKHQAKIAEREIFLKQQLDKARREGDSGEAERIERQLASERKRIEEEREAAKERVRASKDQ